MFCVLKAAYSFFGSDNNKAREAKPSGRKEVCHCGLLVT